MEFEKYYEKPRKQAILKLRAEIVKNASAGGDTQRRRLLALAFIRGREYSQLEYKTQAETYCPIGKDTYYGWLARGVAATVERMFIDDVQKHGGETFRMLDKKVFEWMKTHYMKSIADVTVEAQQEAVA